MIGMAVLVGAGVIGFPWLFETQPRPLSSDIAVVNASTPPLPASVAGEGASKPSLVPSVPDTALPTVVARAPETVGVPREEAVSATQAAASSGGGPREEIIDDGAGASQASASADPDEPRTSEAERAKQQAAAKALALEKARAREMAQAKERAAAKAREEAQAREDAKERAQAKALAEAKVRNDAKLKAEAKAKADALAKAPAKPKVDIAQAKAPAKPVPKPDAKAAGDGTRYIVQVGAFGDARAAHEARMKVERLGIKTYTQQVDAGGSKKIRVRVGPYANKAEADKAMNTLRKAGLVGALLTL